MEKHARFKSADSAVCWSWELAGWPAGMFVVGTENRDGQSDSLTF